MLYHNDNMNDTRSLAGAASLGVNTVLMLFMAASLANLPWWGRSGPMPEPRWEGPSGWDPPLDLWQPYVDNPERDVDGPDCLGARHGQFRLLEAPLPPGLSTRPDGPGPHFACVRLDPVGAVQGVRVHGGSDPQLSRMIRSDWRFSASSSGTLGATEWHRVRLTRLPPVAY